MNRIYNGEDKSKGAKVRRWFLTVWKQDIDFKEIWEDYSDIVKGMGGQLERGGKTDKLHYQMYIHMINPCKLTKIRRLLNLGKGEQSGAIFTQKGNNEQVLDYVFKEITGIKNSKFQFGEMCKQGCRSDMEAIRKGIDEGKNLKWVRDNFYSQWIRYHRAFKADRRAYLKELSYKFREVDVECYIGDTRSGKTRKALYKMIGGEELYNRDVYKLGHSNSNNIWFDDYDGEKILLINDFYGDQIKYSELLELLEGHFQRLEEKGAKTYALWEKVIITSNKLPEYWYKNIGLTPALHERLATGGVYWFEKGKEPRLMEEYKIKKGGASAPVRSTSGTKCSRVILEPRTINEIKTKTSTDFNFLHF